MFQWMKPALCTISADFPSISAVPEPVEGVETTGVPHFPQNFLPGVTGAPHFEQITPPALAGAAAPIGFPHLPQNFFPSATSFPHLEQIIFFPLLFTFKYIFYLSVFFKLYSYQLVADKPLLFEHS